MADPELIGTYDSANDWNGACLDCRRGKKLPQWHASTHAADGVACLRVR